MFKGDGQNKNFPILKKLFIRTSLCLTGERIDFGMKIVINFNTKKLRERKRCVKCVSVGVNSEMKAIEKRAN